MRAGQAGLVVASRWPAGRADGQLAKLVASWPAGGQLMATWWPGGGQVDRCGQTDGQSMPWRQSMLLIDQIFLFLNFVDFST